LELVVAPKETRLTGVGARTSTRWSKGWKSSVFAVITAVP
jgi:hypothetical protein